MPVQWDLARAPQGGMLDALKAYQLGSVMRQQQTQAAREEDQFARQERQREALGRAINPQTGQIDQHAATSAYAEAGDLGGLLEYRKTLQGEHAEHAKLIGRLAQGATDQATWTAGLGHAVQAGAITPEEAQQFAEFSPQARAAAMALGGIEEEDYTLAPGATRMRGGQVVASSPYKPEIITGEDGSKFALNPNALTGGPTGGFDQFYSGFLAPAEGGYVARDGRSGAPANFGVNQKANPDIDVASLTPEQAKEIMRTRYWEPSGADQLQGPLQAIHADTAVNMGVGKAKELLQQSGGDPARYMALREQHYRRLGGPDLGGWLERNKSLGEFAGLPPGAVTRITGPKAPSYRPLTAAEKRERGLPEGTAYQINKEGQVTAVGGQAASSSSGVDRKGEASLRKEFDMLPEVKAFRTVRGQYNQIAALAQSERPSAQNDMALVFSFMKMLDPGSVVREGEFANAQNATGVPDRIRNAYNRAKSGNLLNAQQRAEMVRSASQVYRSQRDTYNERAGQYQGYARDSGFDPHRIANRYEDVKPKTAAPTQGWGKARKVG